MGTDPNTVKNYDEFAEKYQLERVGGFHHRYVEIPAMHEMVGKVSGKKILCIGCGTGEEVKYLSDLGADIIGTDISSGMVEQAKKTYPRCDFQVMDMEDLKFNPESFDIVYSSLAIHYVKDWKNVLSQVHKVLKNKGIFLFSTLHPVFSACTKEIVGDWKYDVIGSATNILTNKRKHIGDYFGDGFREDKWKWKDGTSHKIIIYRQTLEEMISKILENDFTLIGCKEPKPIPQGKAVDLNHYEKYEHQPGFIIFKCQK